jgi:TonB family protein
LIPLLQLTFPANFSCVRHRPFPLLFLSVQLFVANFGALSANGQSNQKACRKPPEIASPAMTPKEYREKWKKLKVQGRVAIAIDEDGHVIEAKLIEASPKEAGDAVLATAKTASFKPRPGCGTFRTEIVFSVNQ